MWRLTDLEIGHRNEQKHTLFTNQQGSFFPFAIQATKSLDSVFLLYNVCRIVPNTHAIRYYLQELIKYEYLVQTMFYA